MNNTSKRNTNYTWKISKAKFTRERENIFSKYQNLFIEVRKNNEYK